MNVASKPPTGSTGPPTDLAPPLQIGGVAVDAPFYQAGLAGYSDGAMRIVAREHGCPYCITEAMLDKFLVDGGKGLKIAELTGEDHPICGQLMGSHPADIAAGAGILAGMGYDVVDVNLACPVKKIKKKCRGGHLLSVPEEAVAILEAVREAMDKRPGGGPPLTVKLRRAYDDTPEMAANFRAVFEAAMELGYAGATVHCRTVQQKYIGRGRWPFLRELTDGYGAEAKRRGFVIGGSGDIWTAPDIFAMLDQTGVDWVSVARGCIGNPWIFVQARALMAARAGGKAEPPRPPTVFEQRDVLLRHFELSVSLHGEIMASRMMRKFGIKFSRHHADAAELKKAFIAVQTTRDWRAVLDGFYAADGPGVDAGLTAEALRDLEIGDPSRKVLPYAVEDADETCVPLGAEA